MNKEKMSLTLEEYKKAFPVRWPDEKYKWEAVKRFQNCLDIQADDFYIMFSQATDKAFNLLASLNNFPRQMMMEYTIGTLNVFN